MLSGQAEQLPFQLALAFIKLNILKMEADEKGT